MYVVLLLYTMRVRARACVCVCYITRCVFVCVCVCVQLLYLMNKINEIINLLWTEVTAAREEETEETREDETCCGN